MNQTLLILPSGGARRQESQGRLASSPVILGEPALTMQLLVETLHAIVPRQCHRLSPGGRALLMETVIAASGQETFSLLSRLVPFPGFASALISLWDELKLARVTPTELSRAASELPGGHLRELSQLYGCYQQALDRFDLYDLHEPSRAALATLQQGADLPDELKRFDRITVRHISDLPPLHLALLLEVARHRPLSFILPYDPEEPEPYAGSLQLLESLERTGDDSPLAEPPDFLPPQGPFSASLFSCQPLTQPPSSLELFVSPTPADEALRVADAIRRLLEEGAPPGSIAILCRDTGRHAPLLTEICRRYRLPLAASHGSPLAASPLVHACLAPFYAAGNRLSRQSLVELATSTYISPHVRREKRLELDTVLRDAGYQDESLGTPESALRRHISARRMRGHSTEAEESCLASLRPLIAAARRCNRSATLGEALHLLSGLVEEFRIYRHGIGSGTEESVARDASAIAVFQRIVTDLAADVALLGMTAAPTTPAAVVSLLRQAMTGITLPSRSSDSISLLSFAEARGMFFDHVFIMGLNEGLCPAHPSPHPLLSDADRMALNGIWHQRRLATSSDRAKDEPLLLRFAVAAARKTLSLSCASRDEAGTTLLLSDYLEEILTNTGLPLKKSGPSAPPIPLQRCTDRQELLSSLLPFPDAEPEPLARDLTRIRTNALHERLRTLCPSPPTPADGSPYSGILARPDILANLRDHFSTTPGNHFSPSLLEEYGRCPFRFFLQRLAGIIPPREPTLDMAATDRGTLLHTLLHAFFERAIADRLLPLSGAPAEGRVLRQSSDEVFCRWEEKHPLPAPLWQAEKTRTLALAAAVLTAEASDASALIPSALEHRFPPLMIEPVDGSAIVLTGIIDRVDRSPDGRHLRVVDYKLSRDMSRYARLLKQEEMGVTSFQMPVYAAAAAQEFGPCVDASVRYWVIRQGDWEEALLPLGGEAGIFLDSSREGIHRGGEQNFFWRVWRMVERMKEGVYPATPAECGYCPFAAICRMAT
jgi:RecB family exonuclease